MEEFNVAEFLRKLEDDQYQQIKPDHPEYFLRLVRKNQEIRSALLKLPAYLPEIETLCHEIDAGNWESISHNYLSKNYPDSTDLSHTKIKDMLLYAFAARRISRAEFHTAHMVLNAKEQFQQEIVPTYRHIDTATRIPAKSVLPSRNEEVNMFNLFDHEGELTEEGFEYIEQITDNLQRVHDAHGIPVNYERAKWFFALEKSFKSVPENLQVFYVISNSLIPGEEQSLSPDEVFWQRQIARTMPLVAGDTKEEQEDEEELVDSFYRFYSPSSAISFAFLELANRGNVVQPVLCLGTLSGQELAKLHSMGYHPVTILDDRVKSNYFAPHNYPAGALYGAMHDEHAHCFLASCYSPSQRQLCCTMLPSAIWKAVNSGDGFEEKLADGMVTALADMNVPSPHLMNDGLFLKVAFIHANLEMEKLRVQLDQITFSKKSEQCINLMERCLQSLKNDQDTDTFGHSPDHASNWAAAEEYLHDIKLQWQIEVAVKAPTVTSSEIDTTYSRRENDPTAIRIHE